MTTQEQAALHALEQKWQPMEFAPKDGRLLELRIHAQCSTIGYYYRAAHAPHNVQYWTDEDRGGHLHPTHWRPYDEA